MAGKGDEDEPAMRALAGPLSGPSGSAREARITRRARGWGAGMPRSSESGYWGHSGEMEVPHETPETRDFSLDKHGMFESSTSDWREPRTDHAQHGQTRAVLAAS